MLYDLFSNKNNACEQLKLIMSIVTRASTKKNVKKDNGMDG